jgi:thioredoxin
MEKKSNINIVIAIVVILAVLGVGVAIKFSQGSTDSKKTTTGQTADDSNPAIKVEAPEINITADNFDAEVKNYKGVVMVDMYSPTCPHCQKMGPIVTATAKEVEGKYKVGKLNAVINSDLATSYKIESVPALIFFKDGVEAKRLIGEQTKEKLIETLNEVAATK